MGTRREKKITHFYEKKSKSGLKKNEGTPTEDKVAEIFLAIIPLLPIPTVMIFPLQLEINSVALIKSLFNTKSAPNFAEPIRGPNFFSDTEVLSA